MPESVSRIHQYLDVLRRRARGLLAVRAALASVLAWVGAWLALAVGMSANLLGPAHGGWWVGCALLAGVAAFAWRLREWRQAGDRRRLAEQVEAVATDLGGELLTVLDRVANPMGSPALLERVAKRTEGRVVQVPAREVVPLAPVRRSAGFVVLALLALALGGLLLPVGPVDALRLLLAPRATTQAPVAAESTGPRALVGDITLRYLYPTYTRLEPMEVPNSSGEVRAPPGTRVEVRARTAVAYPSAVLEVYADPPAPVEVTEGRSLAAGFLVAGDGIWRFRFGDLPSPDYRIVPDPDLAPDVSVSVAQRKLTLAVDQSLPLRWAAKDDYGISRVVVEITGKGPAREVELRRPLDGPRQLADDGRVTAADLGLVPGDKVTLRVKAWDNDGVSGIKAGSSAPIEVEVVGPHGTGARAMETRRALRDALLGVLADFLVEPSPPYGAGSEGAAWATRANARYEALDALVQSTWGGVEGTGVDYLAVDEVNTRRRALLSFARAGTGGGLTAADLGTLITLGQAHTEALEGAILLLDGILRSAAAQEVAKLAQTLADDATRLQQDFSNLSRDQLLARLDQLERFLQQIQAQAAKLGDPQLSEFVNQRAGQLDELMEQIRKAVAAGRMDEARALMQRLAEQMQDMADQLKESQESRGKEDSKLGEALEKLQGEMEKLAEDQAALRKETAAAQEQFGSDMDEAVKGWEEIERRTQAVVERARAAVPQASADGMPPSLSRYATDARDEAEGLLDSVRARSLDTALERVERARYQAEGVRDAVDAALRRMPSLAGPLTELRRTATNQPAELERIRRLLEEMQSNRQQSSPDLQRALQKLAGQQQAIQERAQAAARDADQLSKSLPMKAPGLREGAGQGAEQAQRAADGLSQGDPMESLGGQQAAEEGFRQASDALQQAKQNLQAMQQAASGEGKGDEQGDGGEDRKGEGMKSSQRDEMTLPAPEEFATPEAYRNALLHGMSGDVPDEYKTLNRRYYEELVRQ